MAKREVREVEDGWPTACSGVEHVERGVEIAIEVDDRTCIAGEGERCISGIPPSVRNTARQSRHLSRLYGDALTADVRGQGAGDHDPLLVFEMVDV
jgi:hypothetical protein